MTVAAVSGSGIAVAVGGGSGVTVGGTGVCVGVVVGGACVGVDVAVGGIGVSVGTDCAPPHPASNNTTSAKPNSCRNRVPSLMVLLLYLLMEAEGLQILRLFAYQRDQALILLSTKEPRVRTPVPEAVWQ